MKATDLLEKQHRELERIFEKIRLGEGPVRKLVDELADSLVAHQIIEERVFDPAVQRALLDRVPPGEEPGKSNSIVLQCIEEHAMATIALRRLLATEPDESAFDARVTVLRDLWLSHVAEEEEELFPLVLEAMDADTLSELGAQLEELYEATKARGHAPILAGEEARRERRSRPKMNGRGGRQHVH